VELEKPPGSGRIPSRWRLPALPWSRLPGSPLAQDRPRLHARVIAPGGPVDEHGFGHAPMVGGRSGKRLPGKPATTLYPPRYKGVALGGRASWRGRRGRA
jgi:hypothetical protein